MDFFFHNQISKQKVDGQFFEICKFIRMCHYMTPGSAITCILKITSEYPNLTRFSNIHVPILRTTRTIIQNYFLWNGSRSGSNIYPNPISFGQKAQPEIFW